MKGEGGEAYTFGSAQWPSSKFAKSIPAFQAEKIKSTLYSETYILISLAEVKKADYSSYAETVQKQFLEDTYSYKSDGTLSYGGSNKKTRQSALLMTAGNHAADIPYKKRDRVKHLKRLRAENSTGGFL